MTRQSDEPTIQWVPAPPGAPTPPSRHPALGLPARTWTYLNADGDVIGYINRYNQPNGKKQFCPQIYDGQRWHWRSWQSPRPLYGLDRLARRPTAWVVVVEGEKASDAAEAFIPDCVVVSAPGGKQSLKHADWSVLIGRPGVILWPDNDHDQGSQKAFQELAAHLAFLGLRVKVIDPTGHADGWDAADANFTPGEMKAWVKPRISVYDGPAESPWVREAEQKAAETRREHAEQQRVAMAVNERPKTNPYAGTDPYDILGKPAIPALKPEFLPRAIREFVFDESELLGADPGILGMASLIAIAGCANDGWRLQAKQKDEGWAEAPRLWGAWIADPSSKKSPASARAIKPLREIDARLRQRARVEGERYRLEAAVYRDMESKWIKERSKALTHGGSCSSPPVKPDEPPDYRLLAQDITIEKLGIVLKDNQRGIVMNFDELSGWFGQMDAYKSSGAAGSMDRAKYLELYNGGVQTVDRIGRESIVIPNWSACIMGGIQPSSIRSIASKLPEDGLLQRFMVVMAQDVDSIGVDRERNSAAAYRYSGMLERLAAHNGPTPMIRMSAEARAILVRLETELLDIRRLGFASERVKAALGKYSGLFVRLCLVYHLADAADKGVEPPQFVTGDTAWSVFEFMSCYLVGHLVAFYDDLLGDVRHSEDAKAIGRIILSQRWESLSNRDIYRYHTPWKRMPDWHRASVLKYLEDTGWLYPVSPDGGRRTVHWDVNPRVFELFYRDGEDESSLRVQRVDAQRSGALARGMQRTQTRAA